MPKVSFYLARPNAESETVIFARISYRGNRLKYYTLKHINPVYWNKKTKRAKETAKFKQHPEFNRSLNEFVSDVDSIFSKYHSDNGAVPAPKTLKELLDKQIKQQEEVVPDKMSFMGFFKDFMDRSIAGTRINYKDKKPIVNSTAKGYKTTFNQLESFQKRYGRKIDFESIDLEFYNDFLKFLTDAKLSRNYIGDQIKRIKAVLNEATEKGLNTNFAFKSRYFAKPSEEADNIYLTEEELEQIEKMDLANNPKLDSVRDLFLVGCWTGLRYSDFSRLRQDDIKEGMITIKQTKTGYPVVIPMHRVVKEIIAKYKGAWPRVISNQKMNDYLKEIAKKVELLKKPAHKQITKGGQKLNINLARWQRVSTHTARRSFCTNMYKMGVPSLVIMAISGHRTERAFLKYIKITPDGHARDLQRIWDLKDNQLKAV